MRHGWLVLILGIALGVLPACAPAAAAVPMERAKPASQADHIAAALRRDPVYVTDHAPRALPPDTAARIKASVARLGVPTYVAVTPLIGLGHDDPRYTLVPLLRDRLGADGLYIVVQPSGGYGEAEQFGGGRRLPVRDAWWAARAEVPTDVGAAGMIDRFVEIALSGLAGEKRGDPGERPRSRLRRALDEYETTKRRAALIEWGLFGAGTALGGGATVGALALRRSARTRREARRRQDRKRKARRQQDRRQQPQRRRSKGRGRR